MKTNFSLAAIAVSLFLFLGCKKETTTPDATNLKAFFSSSTVQSQSFTINASTFQQVVGAKNTIIRFYQGSLVDANGNMVTGNVQVELKELYSPGDMIRSNATTTSNGILLQTGGEIYLKVRQNGQELRVNPAIPLAVSFPATNATPGMQLFYGGFVADNTVAADSLMNWNVACACTTGNAVIVQDTVGSSQYYQFWGIDSLGWTNCDRFWNLTGGTDVKIQLPQGFDNNNTQVYMIFDAEKAIAPADVFLNQLFSFHAGEHTPIGINVTIIAIAVKGDQHYYGVEHKVTAAGATFNVAMTASTKDGITAALDGL